jgi:hypothetical protein
MSPSQRWALRGHYAKMSCCGDPGSYSQRTHRILGVKVQWQSNMYLEEAEEGQKKELSAVIIHYHNNVDLIRIWGL